ncbi:FtsX-like permease family protein [Propioniciclava sinopodophylli]|uniref:FtsX-like permease family protein n=1 Tax=Propioniciclava sinopodophylli TaxID=1837344 RepID=UPI00248FD03E|nr:FtsX-like permease family protein [Propioniciclava sinopodophylli]
MASPLAVLAEAARAARAHLVGTCTTALLVAALVAGVLLLVGESASAEDRVLGQIDVAGTRTLIVRAGPDQPLPPSFVAALEHTGEVEHVLGLGPITDARPLANPGGPAIAARTAYGTLGVSGDLPALATGSRAGVASARTSATAGFVHGVGTLAADDGALVEVIGAVDLPPSLGFLEPVVLLPRAADDPQVTSEGLTLLTVTARHPRDLQGVESLVRSLLAAAGVDGATVETSLALAEVRAAVSGELGEYRRTVTATALLLGVLLVSVSAFATTSRQRRTFGRRRALGARRSLVALLILVEVAIPAALGAATGTAVALVAGLALDRPHAPLPFIVSLAVAAVGAAVAGASLPAVLAARRDPLLELRVP